MPGLRGDLLERDVELALLDELLHATRAGSGQILVIEGPAGIGKTQLLAAARERGTEAGMVLLNARAGELEREFPFGVVRQLFEPLLAAAPPDERDALLSGAAALAAPVVGIAPAEPAGRAAGQASSATLHGLYWLAAGIAARSPLLMAVDDAHWSDPASLRWLLYMVRRLEELPILLAVAAREAEPGAPNELLNALVTDPATRLVRPAPLSAESTAAFVRTVLGQDVDPEFCLSCHAATGGNPFLLRELAATLEHDGVRPVAGEAARVRELGPPAVSRAVLVRLSRLPPAATELARAVSVLEAGPTLHEAAEFAGLTPDDATEAADALAAADVFQPERPLRFTHPIVRRAIYEDLPAGERARRHARRARMLAEGQAAAPEVVAAHVLASEPAADPRAVEALRAGARAAFAQGALDEAIAFLARALAEPPPPEFRPELLLELGVAETRVRRPGAAEHLTEALELTTDATRRAAVALELGRALAMDGRLSDSVEVLDRAIATLPETHGELRMQLEAELIGTARIDLATRSIATERLKRLGGRLGSAGPSERLLLATLAFETAMAGESAKEAGDLAERAFAGGRLLEDETVESPVVYLAANALMLADRFRLAHGYLNDAVADAHARGSVLGFAFASCFRSSVAFRQGLLADAEADARASLDVAQAQGWALGLPNSLDFLLDALIERNELDAAAEAVEANQMEGEIPDTFLFNFLLESRGRLRILQGQVREGIDDLLRCGRRQQAWGTENPSVIHWRSSAALALNGLGEEEEEARQLVTKELELARRFGAPRALGIALTAAGTIEGGDDGTELMREATAVLEDSPALLERARSSISLGAALRRGGQRSEARDHLRTGLDLAHRCGGVALEEHARQELLATGARPRRAILSGVEALTPTERRVAAMAAAGQSNRHIAQAMFVTVKTVEVHLSGAYRKLGIGSRAELSHALAAGGNGDGPGALSTVQ